MPANQLNLTDEQICETFPRLVQFDGTKLYDGLGNLIFDFGSLSIPSGPAIQGSADVELTSGTNTILQVNKTDYKGAFVDYVLFNGTNQRSGRLVITNNGDEALLSELTTNDIGDTSNILFDVTLSATTFDVKLTGVDSENYSLRYIYKYI